jgi:hypothetical protein
MEYAVTVQDQVPTVRGGTRASDLARRVMHAHRDR